MKNWLWSYFMPRPLGFWQAIGMLGAAAIGAYGQREANQAMATSAYEQMAFQERMRGSAHQAEVNDLRMAGLNPVLSGTGGHGAATPGGAQYQAENELDSVASTGMQAMQLRAQLKQMDATTALTKQQEKLALEQTRSEHENIYKRHWESTSNEFTAKILAEELKGKKLEGEIDSSRFGEIMRYLNRVIPGLNSGSSAYRNFAPR